MFWPSVKKKFSWQFKVAGLFLILLALSSCSKALALPSSEGMAVATVFLQQELPEAASADSITVKGTVTAESDSMPLPGVSVLVKGTKTETTTDENGTFSLSLTGESQTLVFSFVGYQKKEVPINGRTTLNVMLREEVVEMDDIVVVGYGSQRRQDLTGSISSISATEIQNKSITTAEQAVQGQVAGVQVIKNSGAPGGGSTVRIRGTNSIRAGNNPLYVVDGLPMGGGSSPTQSPLAMINPQDIVSIEVLKDASATAIYGARGANGVVLITTRQGRSGDTQVSFEATYGINKIRNKLNLLNTEQYINLANEAAANNDESAVFEKSADGYPDTDWQDEVFRSAPRQNYQLSVSGGSEDTRYSLSANFLNEEGILIGSGYQRGSLLSNVDKTIGDKFTIRNHLIVSKARYDIVETGGRGLSSIVNGVLQIPSVVPVKDETGNYVFQTENTI